MLVAASRSTNKLAGALGTFPLTPCLALRLNGTGRRLPHDSKFGRVQIGTLTPPALLESRRRIVANRRSRVFDVFAGAAHRVAPGRTEHQKSSRKEGEYCSFDHMFLLVTIDSRP